MFNIWVQPTAGCLVHHSISPCPVLLWIWKILMHLAIATSQTWPDLRPRNAINEGDTILAPGSPPPSIFGSTAFWNRLITSLDLCHFQNLTFNPSYCSFAFQRKICYNPIAQGFSTVPTAFSLVLILIFVKTALLDECETLVLILSSLSLYWNL